MDSILNMAIRAEYNVVTDLVRGNDAGPLSPVRDRPLNDMEAAKLHELVVANKALMAPLTEDGPVNVKLLISRQTFLFLQSVCIVNSCLTIRETPLCST